MRSTSHRNVERAGSDETTYSASLEDAKYTISIFWEKKQETEKRKWRDIGSSYSHSETDSFQLKIVSLLQLAKTIARFSTRNVGNRPLLFRKFQSTPHLFADGKSLCWKGFLSFHQINQNGSVLPQNGGVCVCACECERETKKESSKRARVRRLGRLHTASELRKVIGSKLQSRLYVYIRKVWTLNKYCHTDCELLFFFFNFENCVLLT